MKEWETGLFSGALRHDLSVVAALLYDRSSADAAPRESLAELANGQQEEAYGRFVRQHQLGLADRLAFLLALMAEFHQDFLGELQRKGTHRKGGEFSETPQGTLLPTLQSFAQLQGPLLGLDWPSSLAVFSQDGPLVRQHLIQWLPTTAEGLVTDRRYRLSQEGLELLLKGKRSRPEFGPGFPAKRIHTPQHWDDLVLAPTTRRQVDEIFLWLKHAKALREEYGLRRMMKPGFRCLFHGPPGTGKTMTAGLLGKMTGRDVYRIDLSQVVSKYIGETEKNLSLIFDKAEHQHWILFFDEADSLFGKRGRVSDARDRYANQEVSFLLQRVEDFDGLVILATNFKSNLDDAFLRRFQSIVNFPLPRTPERRQLWKQMLPAKASLESGLRIADIAKQYELSGASILNVVQYATLMAIERGQGLILEKDLLEGVRREYETVGKAL